LWIGGAAIVVLFALAYFFLMPVAEVAKVQRGTAISAVYGTVRIEPAFVVRVRRKTTGLSGWPNLSLPVAAQSAKACKEANY
jgi:hypothetical protein